MPLAMILHSSGASTSAIKRRKKYQQQQQLQLQQQQEQGQQPTTTRTKNKKHDNLGMPRCLFLKSIEHYTQVFPALEGGAGAANS